MAETLVQLTCISTKAFRLNCTLCKEMPYDPIRYMYTSISHVT